MKAAIFLLVLVACVIQTTLGFFNCKKFQQLLHVSASGGTKKEFRGAVIVKLFTLVNYGTTSFHGMTIHGTSLHGMHLIHICSSNLVVHGMTFMKKERWLYWQPILT
jgi:hypothetical protein